MREKKCLRAECDNKIVLNQGDRFDKWESKKYCCKECSVKANKRSRPYVEPRQTDARK